MSHLLAEIKIENYKSILSEVFELSAYTPLIGYNNAGKSNILSAIKWLLRRTSLQVNDFNNLDLPVVVEGRIDGITDELLNSILPSHKVSISKFIVDGSLQIRRTQLVPGDSVARIKLQVFSSEATAGSEWVSNPTGIDNALNALFPEPIQIGAMENAEEDVSKSKTTTTIGKLLGEIIGPLETQYGAQVRNVLDELKGIMDADGHSRAAELRQFDTAVNQKIDSFFPDINIKLHVPTPELKEVFNKGTIKIYEHQDSEGRDISSLGHGAQRSIQMALIRHLAELKREEENHNTTTLLLIDEPELYLHPQAIEIVRDSLKALSTEGYQVVFSTHSAIMVTSDDIADAVLIRKTRARGTYKRSTLKSAVPHIEADSASQIGLLFSLSNSSKILFSEKIILAEGRTEQKLLPRLFEAIAGKSMGLHKYALISMGGVASTKKSMQVLEVMDLPTRSIVDLDFGFINAIKDGFLDEEDTDVVACHMIFDEIASSNGITLAQNGWPAKSSSMTAAEAFVVLANQIKAQPHIEAIHQKLLLHGIWLWRMGSIETHLGIVGKNEMVWASFANLMKSSYLPDLIRDYNGVADCINWLIGNEAI
ncbi:ATP-dependent nuclease [Hymenobacter bucti]|uniref:ATP-dependent endonuclease n=1 Tax=Hymenobacter bucti TaxID=1844114 RepID=A0ABW4QUQ5_9BACT